MARMTIANAALLAEVVRAVEEGCNADLRVEGRSMYPFLLHDTDIVTLAPAGGRTLRRGMIVLFRYRGAYVLHRIVRLHGDTFTACGDGNHRQTETARTTDVAAIVSARHRGGRTLRYPSLRWRAESALSRLRKAVRTVILDMRRRRHAANS